MPLEALQPRDEIYIRWSADFEFWHRNTFGAEALSQIQLDIMGQIELFVSQPGKWTLAPQSVAQRLCTSAAVRQCTPGFSVPNRALYLLRHRDSAETATIRSFLGTLRDVLQERQTEGLLL